MKLTALLVSLMLCFALIGCNGTLEKESRYTAKIKEQSLNLVGLPNIINFFEMGQLKEIYELRDNPKIVMYWYTKNQYTGKWVYEGKCMGYGIPYGASITNPETYFHTGATIPLAEPNGLYTNNVTSSATWILSLDESGKIRPTYVEQEIRVTPDKIRRALVEEFSITEDY